MKTTSLLALSLTLGTFAFAQDQQSAAPASAAAVSASPADLPPVNHLVYLDKLPTPSALMKEARAQGQTIQRIDRTNDSVVVTYRFADGHTDTTGYTTLASASTVEEPNVVASTAPAPAPANTLTAAPATTVVTAPPPAYTTVVYQSPAPVYYGYAPRYYYNDPLNNFWGPLVLGVGIGWATGWHGGGYHYHGWHR